MEIGQVWEALRRALLPHRWFRVTLNMGTGAVESVPSRDWKRMLTALDLCEGEVMTIICEDTGEHLLQVWCRGVDYRHAAERVMPLLHLQYRQAKIGLAGEE
jgi:hypothetical protein